MFADDTITKVRLPGIPTRYCEMPVEKEGSVNSLTYDRESMIEDYSRIVTHGSAGMVYHTN